MNAPNDSTAPRGLRGWWASPQRSGTRRLINPWEYRHLRASGATRIASGSVLAFGGVLLLSYGAYGWATLFLVLGALNLGGGCWYIIMVGDTRPTHVADRRMALVFPATDHLGS